MARPTKRRRSNGSVTFHKAKKRWYARYWVGGKRKDIYGKTKKEVELKLNRMTVLVSDGRLVAENPKFKDYAEAWLELRSMTGKINPKTHDQYRRNLAKISSFIGDMKLRDIKNAHIERIYASEKARGISSNTIHSLHRTLATLWKSAMKTSLVMIEVPNNVEKTKQTKSNPVMLSEEEFVALKKASRKINNGLLVEFLLMTGMRVSVEALATKWKQLDFVKKSVNVGKSKTEAGKGRTIPLDDELIDLLHAKYVESGMKDEGLVFISEDGFVPRIENLRRYMFKDVKKLAEVSDKLTFHHLRHNTGSYLLSKNIPIPTVSKILGHANPSITMSVYAHELKVDDSAVREAFNLLGVNNGK